MNKITLFFSKTLTLMFSLFVLSCSFANNGDVFNIKDNINKSLINKKAIASQVHLSKKIFIPVTFDATSKGNGTINLNGLLVRVFDQHDDGIVYENNFLEMETKDLNNDNIKEIIFTGIIKHTGEKESDPVSYEPIVNIYQLNCSTGIFDLFYNSNSYLIELSDAQKTPIKCIN